MLLMIAKETTAMSRCWHVVVVVVVVMLLLMLVGVLHRRLESVVILLKI